MAAAQLAPIAANVAEDVGASAVGLTAGVAEHVTMMAHQGADCAKQEEEAGETVLASDDT